MCGICGFLQYSQRIQEPLDFDSDHVLSNMTKCIAHRGPDSSGIHSAQGLGLGFRRLSIIDLSENGNQPIFSNDNRYALVFNGEIYNYKALRIELEQLGACFKSNTDSEVVVHGYAHWGLGLLDKLRGMFAFAIWDNTTRQLLVVRDHFGIKPLYYTRNTRDNSLLFGSEIKSFLEHPAFIKELNPDSLVSYLSFQYSAMEETFFKEVYKLAPGHYLLISQDDQENPIPRPYHTFEYDYSEAQSFEENLELVQKTMRESVDLHLQSDVEVGTFLSGGIDSSYITSLVRPNHSFSVGFGEYESGGFNEIDYARRLSKKLGVNHHHRDLYAHECLDILPKLQYHMDEPQGNFSSVPLYFLAQLAKEYVTVVLSGEGADELFGGYDTYRDSDYARKYKKLPFALRQKIRSVAQYLPHDHFRQAFVRAGQKPREYYLGQMSIYTTDGARSVLKPKYQSGPSAFDILSHRYDEVEALPELDQKQLIDMECWLPSDILLKADKMSSAHSLELRVPFLDINVWRVARTLPPNQRISGLETKTLLRHAALANIPQEWAMRPKMGFMVPLRDWLTQDLWYKSFKEMFQSDVAREFFDTNKLLYMLDAHYHKRARFQHELYLPYTFLVWYQEFFIRR